MKKNYALLFVLTAIYGFITFITPTSAKSLAKYHISSLGLHLVSLSITIPIVIIWIIAFYGFIKFKAYAKSIDDRPDGKFLGKVALGLEVLAIYLVLSSIVSSIGSYISLKHLSQVPREVIVANYLAVIFYGLTFYLTLKGANGLSKTTKKSYNYLKLKWWTVVYLLLAAGYAYLAMTSKFKSTPATDTTHGLYYLPNWLILISVILPTILIWFAGLQTVSLLAYYRKNTQGRIYKQSLSKLTTGLSIVIVLTISLQFLGIIVQRYSNGLANLSLPAILLIVYILVIAIAVGYMVIALGAKNLKRLEEIV